MRFQRGIRFINQHKFVFILLVMFANILLFQNFTVAPSGSTPITLEIKSVPVTVCGTKFQKIVMDPHPTVSAISKSLVIAGQEVSVPDQLTAVRGSYAVTVKNSSVYPVNPSIPLLPNIPTSDPEAKQMFRPSTCEVLKQYLSRYKSTSASVSTGLVNLQVSSGNASLFSAARSVSVVGPNATNSTAERLAPVGTDPAPRTRYLIVTQDQYRAEADQLAAYRNGQGIKTQVISVSELPGYDANAPTPAECADSRYTHECYHYWGDPMSDVSQLAVPSLMGYHRQTTAAQQYTRVSFIPGLIRAYIRTLFRTEPLRAVLLIGDPEEIGTAYSPKTPYPSCSYYNAVDERSAYCLGGNRMSMGSDLFYSQPYSILRKSPAQNFAEVSPGMITCEYTDSQNKVRREQKPFCESYEHRYWGEASGPMRAWAWPVYYPFAPMFADDVSPGFINSPFSNLPKSQYVAVGRIVTQSKYKSGGKDPAVQNYINKLIDWEANLPDFYNNAVATFGGNEEWLWTLQLDSFFNTYGSNSKIFASPVLFPGITINYSACLSSPCISSNNDMAIGELALRSKSAWEFEGHGSHYGVQGMYRSENGNVIGTSFTVNNVANIRDDHPVFNPPGYYPVDPALGSNQHYIGHIFANSCNVAEYFIYSSMFNLLKARFPAAAPESFAESLIGKPNGGVINANLNYLEGWSYLDDGYNNLLKYFIKEAYDNNEPIGTAILNLNHHILNYRSDLNYQVLNRVFMGDPFASIARH